MSQFSEYCNCLFEAEGMSLYQFCALHHLERSGIRRMLSGERLPKEELFQAFVCALTITPSEKQKLDMLYERERVGVQKYENRIFVKELLEYIGEQQTFTYRKKTALQNMEISDVPVKAISSRLEIRFLIRQIFRWEEDALYCNFPLEYPELFEILQEEFTEECDKEKDFYHLLTVIKRADISADVNYNLRLMKNILPFAMQDTINYQPCYYYGNSIGNAELNLYPCFLLSSKCLLLLSADENSALLYTDKTVVDSYQAEVRKQLEKLKPLIFKTAQIKNAVEFYIQECVSGEAPIYAMEYYPCVVHTYTREMFLEYLQIDLQNCEPFIQMVDNLAEFEAKCRPYDAFLMMEGLEHFVKTGELGPRYGMMLRPLPLEARKEILHRFELLCRQGKYRLHILPKGFFRSAPVISMELYENQRIMLMSLENTSTFSSFGENTVYEALRDYFESLLNDPRVSTVDETIQILQEMQKTAE